MTRYRTIVADPPWPIGDFPQWGEDEGFIERPYDVMDLPAISGLPVRDFADSDAHLYLWTINEYVADAYTVARAWGFTPSVLLVWCKPTRGVGLGGLFPSNVEFILYGRRSLRAYDDDRILAVTRWLNAQVKNAGVRHSDILRHFGFNRGSGQVGHWTALTPGSQPSVPTLAQWRELKRLLHLPDDLDEEVAALNSAKGEGVPPPKELREATGGRWFTWPRSAHSVKPDAFLDLVEQVSPGPYLELFARRQRLGWDTWGDEALNHVELSA